MSNNILPLREVSINELYNSAESKTYSVPIYQRNYAWEKDEIEALIQDVIDAKNVHKPVYYIGTLVTFDRRDGIFEVIDGQQRLTTIYLILLNLQANLKNGLKYFARRKSDETLRHLRKTDKGLSEENVDYDGGIIQGDKDIKAIFNELIPTEQERTDFLQYLLNNVHIIHYNVPRDIDLNHYFEVMNSRGEQLEMHEIIKAKLISLIEDYEDREKFALVWDACSKMDTYIQQNLKDKNGEVFGKNLDSFSAKDFDSLQFLMEDDDISLGNKSTLNEIISSTDDKDFKEEITKERLDTFQPIIDFPNLLLIVLKLMRMSEPDFKPTDFILDDKELLREFDKYFDNNEKNESFAKDFVFSLLKTKYFLDNYVVHHSNEEDSYGNNPWKLEYWQKEGKTGYLKNLSTGNTDTQNNLVQLLSMFEVAFTPRQRKNYLFYIMLYLFGNDTQIGNTESIESYGEFLEKLADKYLKDIYLVKNNLNERNTPSPGKFDEIILKGNHLNYNSIENQAPDFNNIYGDGSEVSKGIPLFVFNYMDYRLWRYYSDSLKGEKTKEGSVERMDFFNSLGCSDFGLEVFNQFYFSRTRKSLEHFYPQANVSESEGAMNEKQINCFGNYAMIGSAANTSGSNWSPETKIDYYLDSSGKIPKISTASLKFMVMMRKCRDNKYNDKHIGAKWSFEDVKEHQEKMLKILLSFIF